MFKSKVICFAFSALMFSGCASYYDAPTQNVFFEASEGVSADCYLKNDDYAYHFLTPADVTIERGYASLMLDCKAPGYEDFKQTLPVRLNPTTGWNALNLGAGVLYDAGTRTLPEYADHITIEMVPLPNAIAFTEGDVLPETSPAEVKELEFYNPPAEPVMADKTAEEVLSRGTKQTK